LLLPLLLLLLLLLPQVWCCAVHQAGCGEAECAAVGIPGPAAAHEDGTARCRKDADQLALPQQLLLLLLLLLLGFACCTLGWLLVALGALQYQAQLRLHLLFVVCKVLPAEGDRGMG
jgi:hypothetical protein